VFVLVRIFTPKEVNHAIALAKTPLAFSHWKNLLLNFDAVSKFNFLNAKNLMFLGASGMLVRFVGIGGTRVLVDWNDDTKDEKTRRSQTAERVFIEVGGTFLATYVALQAMMDLTGKGLGVASHLLEKPLENASQQVAKNSVWQAILKPRSLNPAVLLKEAQARHAKGEISEGDLHAMTQTIMTLGNHHNPYSFGFNAPEQTVLGKWEITQFADAMQENGLGHLFQKERLPNGRVQFTGLLNQNKAVENYFGRVHAMGVVTAITGAAFSAWISGGPTQKANDEIFRPWWRHRLDVKMKEKQLAEHAKPFPQKDASLSLGGYHNERPPAVVRPQRTMSRMTTPLYASQSQGGL